MKILIFLSALFVLFLIYVTIENQLLITRKYKITLNNSKGRMLKIVQISDLHKKKYSHDWNRLYAKIKPLSPDIIIISGDLVSRSMTDFEYTGVLIKRLCDICPVYYARGNHELDLNDAYMSKLRETLINNGAIVLENSKATYQYNGICVDIYGADLKRSIYRNEKNGFSGLENYSAQELSDILGKPEGTSLLIAHNPFFFGEYAKWGADITFSGHVHAGIINTPFGGVLSPERKFFPSYTKGIYENNSKRMVVSAGIGKLRIFNPSEILYLEVDI